MILNRSSTSGLQHLYRCGTVDGVPLSKVHAELREALPNGVVLDEFRDGLLAGNLRDSIDRLHNCVARLIGIELPNEATIDLEIVNRQILQVSERTQAAAKVVQSEAKAELAQLAHHLRGRTEIGHGSCLRDF